MVLVGPLEESQALVSCQAWISSRACTCIYRTQPVRNSYSHETKLDQKPKMTMPLWSLPRCLIKNLFRLNCSHACQNTESINDRTATQRNLWFWGELYIWHWCSKHSGRYSWGGGDLSPPPPSWLQSCQRDSWQHLWKARSFKHSKTTSNVLVFNLSPTSRYN